MHGLKRGVQTHNLRDVHVVAVYEKYILWFQVGVYQAKVVEDCREWRHPRLSWGAIA